MTSSIQHAPAQPPFIPPWIKTRLDELGITEEMFEDLLKIYESVRDEYIDLTKKVFIKIIFFKLVKFAFSEKVAKFEKKIFVILLTRVSCSFLNLTLCTVTFSRSTYRCGNYLREETIEGRKLYEEIR